LAHWIVDAIALAYQTQGMQCPFGVIAHSTRIVISSLVFSRHLKGAGLDGCTFDFFFFTGFQTDPESKIYAQERITFTAGD